MATTAARTRPVTDPVETVRRARWVLVVSAVVTLGLYWIPFGDIIARPLLYLSTLVHELGHGLGAMLVGGSFERLEMWSDGSGVAWTASSGAGQRALTIAGGLVGPAVGAAIGFVLARRRRWARWALWAIALLVTGNWVLSELVSFTQSLFDQLPALLDRT